MKTAVCYQNAMRIVVRQANQFLLSELRHRKSPMLLFTVMPHNHTLQELYYLHQGGDAFNLLLTSFTASLKIWDKQPAPFPLQTTMSTQKETPFWLCCYCSVSRLEFAAAVVKRFSRRKARLLGLFRYLQSTQTSRSLSGVTAFCRFYTLSVNV